MLGQVLQYDYFFLQEEVKIYENSFLNNKMTGKEQSKEHL
jgi:hypothetical protein